MFLLALAWSWSLARITTPMGASEDHFAIGQRLYRTGSLAGESDPGVFRPPGYPAFVAATLHVRDVIAAVRSSAPAHAMADDGAVLLAQCLVVAATAAALFAFGATLLPRFEAACVGLVVACGPIALSLIGLQSYYLLHILGIALGTAQLALAAGTPRVRPADAVVAGLLWGISTLVRPVTLILPPFVFLLVRLRRGGAWRSAAFFTLLFTAGMAMAIVPYTVRNHAVTGRWVLVNAQGGFALWATATARPPADEEFIHWPRLWGQQGMNLYREVTGESEYDPATFNTRVVELEAAFTRQALRNLRSRPSLYFQNVVQNLRGFLTDPMGSWPSTFADLNRLAPDRTDFLVSAYGTGLLLLALPGLARGLWRRDAPAWTVLLVFCSLAVAHSMTYLNQRFTYVKLPLLAMGFAISLAAIGDRSIVLGRPRLRLRLAAVLAVTMLAASASATLLGLAR